MLWVWIHRPDNKQLDSHLMRKANSLIWMRFSRRIRILRVLKHPEKLLALPINIWLHFGICNQFNQFLIEFCFDSTCFRLSSVTYTSKEEKVLHYLFNKCSHTKKTKNIFVCYWRYNGFMLNTILSLSDVQFT